MTVLIAPDAPFRVTSPIEHVTKVIDADTGTWDGTLLVHVVATSEAPDSQGEIVDYDAAKAAAPAFLKWATLTEMHDTATSPGTALQLHFDDVHRRIEADLHVVDPVAVRKVLSRTYKAVSIGGIKLATRMVAIAGKTYRVITKLLWDELALVTRGANPDALIAKQFILAKRDATMDPLDAGMASPLEDTRTPEQVAIDATRAALAKDVNGPPEGGEDRADIPAADFAGKDKSFPIVTPSSVSGAARLIGRAGPDNFSSDELKANIIRIAERKGPAFVAALPKAWKKESKKMAKAAQAAEAAAEEITKADAPPPPADADDAKPAFEGAAAPFKSKKKARKAARVAKAAARASSVKAASALVKAYAAARTATDDETTAAVRRVAKQAPKLAARAAKLAKANQKLRKSDQALRKERRELRKAAAFTSVLTKSGARNSTSDLAKIDAIHAATVDLGTSSHVVVAPAPIVADAAADSPIVAKTDEATLDRQAMIAQALRDLVPVSKLDDLMAKLTAVDERSVAQGEQIAKFSRRSTGGGPATPYAPVFEVNGGRRSDGDITDKGSALAKAAELIDDPRLKEQVGDAAGLEMIKNARRG
ncbi:MAG: hypothetical protein ACRDGQ_06750 [Candidatus Limnocylindrales bacterium]